MDANTLQMFRMIHDRRQADADDKLEEWKTYPPPPNFVIGKPLVAVPLDDYRSLLEAVEPKPEDGRDEMKRIEELRKGARGADSAEVAIYLEHLKFLLDRVESE